MRERAAGFSEIREAMELNPASTVRLLKALVDRGYLRKTEAGYLVGPAMERLRATSDPVERLRVVARSVITTLSEATGCSALALWWSGRHTLCVAKQVHPDAPSMQPVDQLSRKLFGGPWLDLALAELAPGERAALARAYGESPAQAKAVARTAAEQLANRGYVFDDGRYHPDIRRLAAPVRGPDGGLQGMLALGGTRSGLSKTRLPEAGARLVAAAETLSRRMGAES